MPNPPAADPMLAALNAGPNDPTPPPTWVVLQFGVAARPAVSCSTNLGLAIAEFLQLAHALAALARTEDFRLIGIDDDFALQGLSLFQGESLVLVLQPAAGLVRHPMHPDYPGLPDRSFAESAPLLLAALSRRKDLSDAEVTPFIRSSVGLSWTSNIDDAMFEGALTEDAVRGTFSDAELDRAWAAIRSARTMQCLTPPAFE